MKLDRPCMNVLCAEKLLSLAVNAKTILEWGSGGSTVYLSNNVKEDTTIYSIEHDVAFYNMVRPQLKSSVMYTLAREKNEYVTAPPTNIHYSLVLVDGVHRKECLEHVRANLSWNILLLHDAERERYKPWMAAFDDEKYTKSFVKNLWICEKNK